MGAVVAGLAGRLELQQDHVRDPVREELAAGAVADAAVAQLPGQLLDLVRGDPQPARSSAEHERLRGGLDRRPQDVVQQLGHPRVALDRGRLVGVGAADGRGRDQVGHRGLGDVELAERGQHVPDVGEEGEVRAHDDHAAPGHLLLVRVEEVRHPVQADGGLPGAGRALHAHGRGRAGPDDVVLLGLDRRDDVAHRAGSWALDLVDQQVAGGLKVSLVPNGPGRLRRLSLLLNRSSS